MEENTLWVKKEKGKPRKQAEIREAQWQKPFQVQPKNQLGQNGKTTQMFLNKDRVILTASFSQGVRKKGSLWQMK